MNIPIGLELPIKLGNQGYFQQTFDTTTAVKNNVRTFYSTRRGEVPMQPNYGTKLFDVIFEQNTDDLESIIQQTMLDEVEMMRFPITVLEINIDRSDNNIDAYRVGIEFKFVVNNDDVNVQTINLEVNG
jgi:phage baseplate assembly protein W